MIRQNYQKFVDHVRSNVYALYAMADTEIFDFTFKYLKPNIPIYLHPMLQQECLRYWKGRRTYGGVDENGFPLYINDVKPVVDYTIRVLFDQLHKYESEVENIWRVRPDAKIISCEDCGELVDEADIRYCEEEGELLCDLCYNEKFQECVLCGEVTPAYQLMTLFRPDTRHVLICEDCRRDSPLLKRCPRCHTTRFQEDMVVVELPEGKEIECCEKCAYNFVRTCEECGTRFSLINRYNGGFEGMYCDKCLFKYGTYQSYKYKPSTFYFKTIKGEKRNTNTLFFGLELECEIVTDRTQEDFAQRMKKGYTSEDFYVVYDGSLTHGIEVALMPISEAWYKANKKWLLHIYNRMQELGGDFSLDGVGLHIHTSKDAWSPSQIYKLMRFCYDPDHTDILKQLYGRGARHHAQKREDEYRYATQVAKSGKNITDADHYNMINMSTGTTIEFRMFRGTNSIERLFTYIDFVRAIHQFTRDYGLTAMTMHNFARMVQSKTEYRSIQPYFMEVS